MIRQLLSISTVPMRLELNVSSGQFNMSSPKAELEISSTKSKLDINSDRIKIKIDGRDMRASMGLYTQDMFRKKTERDAKEVTLQAIGDIGEDWRTITESQGRAFIDVCMKNAGWRYDLPTTIGWLPNVKPDISWEGGGLSKISFSHHSLEIKWRTNERPAIEYNTGKKDIRVSQYNKVNIEYLGT